MALIATAKPAWTRKKDSTRTAARSTRKIGMLELATDLQQMSTRPGHTLAVSCTLE